MLELTDEEIANGWTAETLAAYIEERERAQASKVLRDRTPARPKWANNRYSPMRWREG